MSIVNVVANTVFKPAMREVVAITNAPVALVTTSFAHGYYNGMIVRLLVPEFYGMQEANGQSGSITVVSTTEFTMTLDTSSFDLFVIPVARKYPDSKYGPDCWARPYRLLSDGTFCQEQFAQVIPFSEAADMEIAAFKNVLPYP